MKWLIDLFKPNKVIILGNIKFVWVILKYNKHEIYVFDNLHFKTCIEAYQFLNKNEFITNDSYYEVKQMVMKL